MASIAFKFCEIAAVQFAFRRFHRLREIAVVPVCGFGIFNEIEVPLCRDFGKVRIYFVVLVALQNSSEAFINFVK